MYNLRTAILSDLRVELLDEFERNFIRKAFFDRPWPTRKMGGRGSLLLVSGRMRRSLRCTANRSSLAFHSDVAYFSLHNRGGTVRVTPAMRKYFWAMYYKYAPTQGPGEKRHTISNGPADYYRALALTKKAEFIIPQRQVVGDHPQVGRIVHATCDRAVREFIDKNIAPKFRKMMKK